MTAHAAASATVGGLAAGLIVGALARLDMRVIALVRGDPPNLSVVGTVGVVITFVLMALALALSYASWSGRRGIAFWTIPGVALFSAVLFLTPLRQELEAPLDLVIFAPVALILGPLAAWITRFASRSLPAGESRLEYRVLGIPAVASLVVLSLLLAAGALQVAGVIPVPVE